METAGLALHNHAAVNYAFRLAASHTTLNHAMKIKDLVNEAAGLARPYRISKGERKIGIFNRSWRDRFEVLCAPFQK